LRRSLFGLTGLLAFSIAASAQAQAITAPPPGPDNRIVGAGDDPWEKFNRAMFIVSGVADIAVIRPVSVFYKRVTPRPGREGVHNVIGNLNQPVIFANQVLQLRPGRAASTAGRFVLNSTVGVGGVFDVASGAGMPEHATNFGQTLGRYGVGTGAYVFLPVTGPSSVRDATGKLVDILLDPFTWARFGGDGYFSVSRAVLGGVDARSAADKTLQTLTKSSIDPYATLRSAYQQNVNFLDNGGKVDVNALPDFGPEPAAPAPSGAPPAAPQPAPAPGAASTSPQ
jgi:phospholipid-binding lipoprotein MlaA